MTRPAAPREKRIRKHRRTCERAVPIKSSQSTGDPIAPSCAAKVIVIMVTPANMRADRAPVQTEWSP